MIVVSHQTLKVYAEWVAGVVEYEHPDATQIKC